MNLKEEILKLTNTAPVVNDDQDLSDDGNLRLMIRYKVNINSSKCIALYRNKGENMFKWFWRG